jgi:excisionase family DNA binding protein
MNVAPPAELVLPEGRKVAYVKELAAATGQSLEAIREAIARGEIKATQVGRRYLIPLAEVRRILCGEGAVTA